MTYKQSNCPYCHKFFGSLEVGTASGIPLGNSGMFISGNTLFASNSYSDVRYCEINYCPICGRKLK